MNMPANHVRDLVEKPARVVADNKANNVKDKAADTNVSNNNANNNNNSNNNNSNNNNNNNNNASSKSSTSAAAVAATSAAAAPVASSSAVAVIDASTNAMARSSSVVSTAPVAAITSSALNPSSTLPVASSLTPSASSAAETQGAAKTSSGSDLSVGAIAGIAVGVAIIALLLIAFFGRRFYKKRNQRKLFGSPKGSTIDDPSYMSADEKTGPGQSDRGMGAVAMMNHGHGGEMTPPPSSQGHGSLYGNVLEPSHSPSAMQSSAINGGMIANAPNRNSVAAPTYMNNGRPQSEIDRRTSLHAAQNFMDSNATDGDAGTSATADAATAAGAAGAAAAASSSPSDKEQYFVVTQTYTPTMPDELDIIIGDKIKIFSEYDDGWCLGVNLDDDAGVRGVFPRYCVEPVEAASSNVQAVQGPGPLSQVAPKATAGFNPAIKVSGSSQDLQNVQPPPEPFRQESSSNIRPVQPLMVNKTANASSNSLSQPQGGESAQPAQSGESFNNYQLPPNNDLARESYDWMASIVDQGKEGANQDIR